jgi:hypothetical protein
LSLLVHVYRLYVSMSGRNWDRNQSFL